MQPIRTRSSLLAATSVLFLALGTACSSSSGGGGNVDPASVMASGVWAITETITQASAQCADEVGFVDNYQVTVQQNGSQLTVTTTVGTFTGSISGNGQVSWTGSFPEDGGTTTITSMALTISGDSLNGSTTWSFQDGGFSCTGATSITGSRISSAGLLGTGTTSVFADSEPLHDWFGEADMVAFVTRDGEDPAWNEIGQLDDVARTELPSGDWRFAAAPRSLTVHDLGGLPAEALELVDPIRVRRNQHTLLVADSILDWVPAR